MEVVRDFLAQGGQPPAIEVIVNGALAADGTAMYAGQLLKLMDYDDEDHGVFFTSFGNATEGENFAGILAEAVAATGNYLPDSSTSAITRNKMIVCLPSTVIRAEYGRKDAAGTANTDTGFTGTAASATMVAPSSGGDADSNIGAWLYFLDGDSAGYLHYIKDMDATTGLTLATALVNGVGATDTLLVIQQAHTRTLDFNATFTGIKSEYVIGSRANAVVGIDHYISTPGIGLEKLDRAKHDGINVGTLARFYHDLAIPVNNLWIAGVKTS